MYVNMFIYVCVCIYICIYLSDIHMCIYIYVCVYTYAHIHISIGGYGRRHDQISLAGALSRRAAKKRRSSGDWELKGSRL